MVAVLLAISTTIGSEQVLSVLVGLKLSEYCFTSIPVNVIPAPEATFRVNSPEPTLVASIDTLVPAFNVTESHVPELGVNVHIASPVLAPPVVPVTGKV